MCVYVQCVFKLLSTCPGWNCAHYAAGCCRTEGSSLVWQERSLFSSWPSGRNAHKALHGVSQSCREPEAQTNTLPGVDFRTVNYAVRLVRSDTERHQECPVRKLIFGLSRDNLPNKWGIVNPAKQLAWTLKFQNVAHPSCLSQIESIFSGSQAHNGFHYCSASLVCDESRKKPMLFASCQYLAEPKQKLTVTAAFMLWEWHSQNSIVATLPEWKEKKKSG